MSPQSFMIFQTVSLAVSPWLGLLFTAAPSFCAGALASGLAALGVLSTARAQLEKTLLVASRDWVLMVQKQHSADGAHISELETEVRRLRGVERSHMQWRESVEHWATRRGHELPRLETLEGRHREGGDYDV